MVADGESLCCGLWAERNDLTGKFMQKALTVVEAAEITGKGTVIIGIDSRITHTDKRLFRRSELRLGAVMTIFPIWTRLALFMRAPPALRPTASGAATTDSA